MIIEYRDDKGGVVRVNARDLMTGPHDPHWRKVRNALQTIDSELEIQGYYVHDYSGDDGDEVCADHHHALKGEPA